MCVFNRPLEVAKLGVAVVATLAVCFAPYLNPADVCCLKHCTRANSATYAVVACASAAPHLSVLPWTVRRQGGQCMVRFVAAAETAQLLGDEEHLTALVREP